MRGRSKIVVQPLGSFYFFGDIGCDSRQNTFVLHDVLINRRTSLTERSWKKTNKMAGLGVSC